MAYTVEVSPAAERELRKLPSQVRNTLLRRLASLRDDPRPPDAKKLSSPENLWRIREDNYRVIYRIKDDVLLVVVVRAGHRKEIYRQLSRLMKSVQK